MNAKHKLLVASARMAGSNFANTVVFIMDHDENGAYGVAVNRKAEEVPCTCGMCPRNPFPVYLGGPCEINNRILMLHGIPRIGKRKYEVMPGLWHGTPNTLNRIISTIPMDDHRFKVVTGYAGWAPGQLENEVAQGCWHLIDATPDLILDGDPDELWETICPQTSNIPTFSDN